MSTEETPIKPEESTPAPVEEVPLPVESTEPTTSPEAPVVEANVDQPITEAAPATEEAAAPAPATEETSAEPAPPAVPEKKEGAKLLGFLKKFPNPKTTAEKKPAATETEAPATTSEPVATEPVEEKPFEGDSVQFRTYGGIFGGGWKSRYLVFGKEDGYTQPALSAYFAAHKIGSLAEKDKDKLNAAWDNAAHATVTGSGLLIIAKAKALDIPLSIINLAEVTSVVTSFGAFTVKTEHFGDYEFQTGSSTKAAQWKTEIDSRLEAAKGAREGVQENDKYKESLAFFKESKVTHAKHTEAITSDEEGAISGDDSKRPKNWTRRISGSFARLAGSSKEATTTEAPKEEAAVAPATETAAATEAAVATETVAAPESAAAEPAAEPTSAPAELSKKEKRKSFTGFGNFLKGKQTSKEVSTEPAKEAATEESSAAPAETAETAAETEPVAAEPTTTEAAPAEETTAPATESKVVEKSKRGSLFGNLLTGKKDKTPATPAAPVTNGEAATEPAVEATEVPAAEETPAVSETGAVTSTPKQKESLSRRLTSQFKSFGRSKSPGKPEQPTKVSDEAPKIDTAIESKPEEEPLSTTEAPLTNVEAPATTETVPSISAQA